LGINHIKIHKYHLVALSALMIITMFFISVFNVKSVKSFLKETADKFFTDSLNITYSVQIAASYKVKMNADSLKHKFNLSAEVKEILHHNWYKYSVGCFISLNDAINLKLELCKEKGLGGAFIVCFRDNIRQENLIINQKLPGAKGSQLKTNYEYRIQIQAVYDKKIPTDTIAKQFNLIEKINEDFDEGWYKYTIGSFDDYNSAKDFRDKLRQKKGLSGCFVVAYEKGQRLSLLPKLRFGGLTSLAINQMPKKTEVDSLKRKALVMKLKESTYNDSLRKDSIIKAVADKNNIHVIAKKPEISHLVHVKKKVLLHDYINKTLLITANIFYPDVIFNFIKTAINRSNHYDRLILVLFFLINLFIIGFLIIAFISFVFAIKINIIKRKTSQLSQSLQNKLAEYINSNGEANGMQKQFREFCDSRFKRRVLIDEIMNFSKNLYGEAKEKLRSLYMEMKLYEDSLRYIRSRSWNIKARGIRQLSQMNFTDAASLIKKNLNSRNEILRFEAQLAYVMISPDEPFFFLDNMKKKFPLWNQLNLHMFVYLNRLKTPEFSHWLSSDKSFVKVFALRMIGLLRQHKAFGDVVLNLNSENKQIKQSAIIALGRLGLGEGAIYLRNIYNQETDENKQLILRALQNLPDESNIQFLGDILKHADNAIRIEAAKGLAYIGEMGRNKLQMLKMTANVESVDLVSIIDHALDKRIV
jgi:hypothetical protein